MRILVHNDGKLDQNLSIPDFILALLPQAQKGNEHNVLCSDKMAEINDWYEKEPLYETDLILTTNIHYALELWVQGKPVHWLIYKAQDKQLKYLWEAIT